jgi:methionyl-tRNA formyltransferase
MNRRMNKQPHIAFFGGEPLAVPVLEKLLEANIIPQLIVCSPDKPVGRGLRLVPPRTKEWAVAQSIEVIQPQTLRDRESLTKLTDNDWDLFVVVAYNHILPKWLLNLPQKGCLNLHPSLLPALRGPSPIRTAILEDRLEAVGVSIMLLDEKMDHGPILEQSIYTPKTWPMPGPELDAELAHMGGELLAEAISLWLNNDISPQEQDDEQASYTKKFEKGENELQIDPFNLPLGVAALAAIMKIYAWAGIGDTFFIYNGKRIKVREANLSANYQLEISSVVPEGKKEMTFHSYLQSLSSK